MGESQDPQGLQRLLEELPLLASSGRWPVGQETVVGARLQEEVGCRGATSRGQGQGYALGSGSPPGFLSGHPRVSVTSSTVQ